MCFTTNVFPAMLAYAAPLCKTIFENAKPAFGLLIVAMSTENHVCYATNVFSATLASACCITMHTIRSDKSRGLNNRTLQVSPLCQIPKVREQSRH
jgi:hypothetical protein